MRYIAIPFVFLYYLFLLIAGLVFPTTLIILLSFASLIVQPFVWLINLGLDDKIESDFPLIDATNNLTLNNLLGVTVLFWGPFYGTYVYFTERKLLF